MGISKDEFTDKAGLEHLIDAEAAELQRYVPEITAQQYRQTKLKALTSLAAPRPVLNAFLATTGAAAVGGVLAAGAATELLGLGNTVGDALFRIGATVAMLSPVFGVIAIAHVSSENRDRQVDLLKEIIRSHRRTEQMRKGTVPDLGLKT